MFGSGIFCLCGGGGAGNAVYDDRRNRCELRYQGHVRNEQAIQRITAEGYNLKHSFEANTNLCVAYTKTGAIGQANEACEAAVLESQNRQRLAPSRSDLALALSNRGVLRAVQGQTDLARQDFNDAVRLKSGLAAPTTNLARLDAIDYAESYSAN